jgi:hypothetical protein
MMPQCDNTNHQGKHNKIDIVEMLPEFEGGFFKWCAKCQRRDKDMILRVVININ